MSDGVKSEISSDIDQNYALNTADPKNVQELTIYVSNKGSLNWLMIITMSMVSSDRSNFKWTIFFCFEI